MADPTYLSKAPIVEAIIDLRVRMAADFNVQVFATLLDRCGLNYKTPQDVTQVELNFVADGSNSPKGKVVNLGVTGFRYETSNRRYIAQFQKDGFSFSHLAPYTNWNDFFSEAARLYLLFFELAQPEEVTRVGVRYINRLLLPEAEIKDFTTYLTAPLPFPKGVHAVLTGFLTQIQIQDPGTGISGRITQTIQPMNDAPGQVPIILDIDVFEEALKPAHPDFALKRFETLRNLKNRFFFSSITEKVVEMYK